MTFVAVVCFIIRQHRRRFYRCEATGVNMGCVNAQSEQPNVGHLDVLSGRSEWRLVDWGRAFLSEETLVQEPPPAYIPHRRGRPWEGQMMQGRVSALEDPLYSASLKQSYCHRRVGPLAGETMGVSCDATEITY
jgi:hypothetical protein